VSEDRGSVELEGVTKRFGATVAVDHLDLEIRPGEFPSLLGPSGCGKTTTLRMLARFEQPDEGWIRISGEYVQPVPAHKRDVNTVFQALRPFPQMTVAKNVASSSWSIVPGRQRRRDPPHHPNSHEEKRMADDDLRILADGAGARRLGEALTRRRFFGVAGLGAASLAFLAACGGDNSSGSSAATGASAAPAGLDPNAKSFNLYNWAEYDDPDFMKSFGSITVDVYNNNEEAVGKLEAAKGTSGYDMVVPSGPYIPQMVATNLLEALDLSLIPNLKNLAAQYTNQPFDPGNKYSVCKDFGSTGWIYDNTVIKTPITSWSDFIKAAQTEASGLTSVLDVASDVCGIYFWANGIDWTTEDAAQLDACEDMIVNQLAPHIKSFNSYPGIDLAQGNYLLSQVFNGDARQGLLSVDDPERYTFGFGAPVSELWMDNWCILKGAKNRDAAYNFLNFILTPENSATDLAFHGYDTGITGVRELLPQDIKFLDMVFLTPDLLTTLVPGEVNSAQDRQVAILDKARAKAGV